MTAPTWQELRDAGHSFDEGYLIDWRNAEQASCSFLNQMRGRR